MSCEFHSFIALFHNWEEKMAVEAKRLCLVFFVLVLSACAAKPAELVPEAAKASNLQCPDVPKFIFVEAEYSGDLRNVGGGTVTCHYRSVIGDSKKFIQYPREENSLCKPASVYDSNWIPSSELFDPSEKCSTAGRSQCQFICALTDSGTTSSGSALSRAAGVKLPNPPHEISGITIDRSRIDKSPLVLVGDESPGKYFACADAVGKPGSGALKKYFKINDCWEYGINNASVATDFESIKKVQDGEYLILSESLHALIVAHGDSKSTASKLWTEGALVGQYYNSYTEVGGHGLEGFAIKADQNGDNKSFNIVASWEGGYPENRRLVEELGNDDLHNKALDPVLVIASEANDLSRTFGRRSTSGSRLQVHEGRISGQAAIRGLEVVSSPGQVFRVTDIVWGKKEGAATNYIVLASSASNSGRPFRYSCLLDLLVTTISIGSKKQIDINITNSLLIKDTNNRADGADNAAYQKFGKKLIDNWEGLAWYDNVKNKPAGTHEDLIIVNDDGGDNFPVALVVSGPAGWGAGNKCPVKHN